ncbi:MAG: cation:proton antiporter [Bdellovibrionaceae bacterium]|nr:cation:proton antiporter [Pseudobdellovibrionaceae bacterium]
MHGDSLVRDIGLAILAAAALGLPAYLFRAPLLLAYLTAGVVLGPHLGFGLITESANIQTVSSIGLVLLMFILGLEIDLKKLLQAGRAVLIGGFAQIFGCTALAVAFFWLLGYGTTQGRYDLVYLAVACSLSSTLVVVKILSDRMEIGTLPSRVSLGVLVLQDFWAIGFLALQPNLNDLQLSVIGLSLGRAVLLVAASGLLARFVLPWVFYRAARSPEVMLVVAMAWCAGVCGLAGALHLSLEMGGLIAGVAIASFPYHVEIAAKISSLRDFFIMLFFVALGLQIPVPNSAMLSLAGVIVAFILISRFLTMFPVLYFMHYGHRSSLLPPLNLSQVSEFSLVLAALGVSFRHIGQDVLSAFTFAFVGTALLSSFSIPNGHTIYRLMSPWLERLGVKDEVAHSEASPTTASEDAAQVVILGFFREGSSLLQELIRRHSETALRHLLVIDLNPEAHRELKSFGVQCKYGDISHPDTLASCGLENAQVLICTLSDNQLKGTSNLKLLRILKTLAPQAKIIVTAETFESGRDMYEAGAAYVYMPRLLAAQHLADVLESIEAGNEARIRENGQRVLTQIKEIIS